MDNQNAVNDLLDYLITHDFPTPEFGAMVCLTQEMMSPVMDHYGKYQSWIDNIHLFAHHMQDGLFARGADICPSRLTDWLGRTFAALSEFDWNQSL